MKKSIPVFIMFALTINSFLFSISQKEKEDLYLAALSEMNMEVKMQKIDDYFSKFGNKDKNLTDLIFLTAVETALKLENYNKVEEYATLAQNFKKIKKRTLLIINLGLATVELKKNKNIEKAISMADSIVNEAKTLKELSPVELKMEFVSPATRLKIAALDSQAKDEPSTKKALQISQDLYNSDKSEDSARFVYYFAKRLYEEYNQREEAFKAIEGICQGYTVNPEYLDQLGIWYIDLGYEDKALDNFIKAYQIKKNARRAFYIGRILSEKDVDKAILYLAESAVFNDANVSDKALDMLKKLYLEEKAADLTEEEKNAGMQKILEEARTRISN